MDRRWLVDALDRYERPLVRYAHRMLGDLDAARDVVQDTFLKLCRQKRAQLDGRLAEWLYTVCRHGAIDHLRKEGRMDRLEDREIATDAPDRVEQRDERSAVLKRVAELPARQREVVRLKFQEGLSYRQIAAITEQSVSNVGFLLHTAIQTLRKQLLRNPS